MENGLEGVPVHTSGGHDVVKAAYGSSLRTEAGRKRQPWQRQLVPWPSGEQVLAAVERDDSAWRGSKCEATITCPHII